MGDNIFILVVIYAIAFGAYFWFTRKHRAGNKEAKERLNQLKPGDHVITIGGLHGLIEEVDQTDNTVILNCDDIFLKFERRAIARVVDGATTVSETTNEEATTEENTTQSDQEG